MAEPITETYSYLIKQEITSDNGTVTTESINFKDALFVPSAQATTEEINQLTDLEEGYEIWDTTTKTKKVYNGTAIEEYRTIAAINPIFRGIITATGGSGSTEDYNIPGLLENATVSVIMRTAPTLLPVSISKVTTSTDTLSVTYSGTPNTNYSINVIAFNP